MPIRGRLAVVIGIVAAAAVGGGAFALVANNTTPELTVPTPVPIPDVAQQVHCDGPAGSTPDGWTFHAYVSGDEGLVVTNVAFGPRLVARKMSVPYLRVVYAGPKKTQRTGSIGHLSARDVRTDPDLRAHLVGDPMCNPDGHTGVRATYAVHSVALKTDFLVEQTYRFDGFNPDTRCEATRSEQCVRFWPTVTWAIPHPSAKPSGVGLDVVQRFEFEPDGVDATAADVTADRLTAHMGVPFVGSGGLGIAHRAKDGALKRAGAVLALDKGQSEDWDNWHQSFRSMVTLPGIPNFHGVGGSGYAGCSECVHAHWGWFGNANARSKFETKPMQLAACRSTTCWTTGKAQILDGSHQTACWGWTSVSDDPPNIDWCRRASEPSDSQPMLEGSPRLVAYWDVRSTDESPSQTGVSIGNSTFPVGDSLWPQREAGNRTNGHYQGDTGAMFIGPARRFSSVSGGAETKAAAVIRPQPPVQNTTAGSRLPAGWVVPVNLRLASADDEGPYYLRVHTSGLRLLNPAPNYVAANTGEPWVNVYNDKAGDLDPDARTSRTMMSSGDPMVAYVVFPRKPMPTDDLSFELDAAPDGIKDYQPSTGRWETATTGRYAFETPSGNIQCMNDNQAGDAAEPNLHLPANRDNRVVCRVIDATWTPPGPPCQAGEPGFLGQISTDHRVLISPCQGDVFTIFPFQGSPNYYRADYDTDIDLGLAICHVAVDGVTCTDKTTGSGFMVSRESYRVF